MRTTENLLAGFGLTHLLNVHFHFLLKKKKKKVDTLNLITTYLVQNKFCSLGTRKMAQQLGMFVALPEDEFSFQHSC